MHEELHERTRRLLDECGEGARGTQARAAAAGSST